MELVKSHGLLFVGYYASLWLLGAGSLFAGLEYHLLGPDMDAIDLARSLHLDQLIDLGE